MSGNQTISYLISSLRFIHLQLLGHLFNWALFGVLSVQVCACSYLKICVSAAVRCINVTVYLADIYYLGFPKDRLLPKCLVVFAYILELVQIVLATRDAFRTFGPGWGDMEVLDQVAWIWFSIPVMSSISNTRFLFVYFTMLMVMSPFIS